MDGTTTMQGTEQEVQNTLQQKRRDSRQRKVHRRK